MIGAPHFPSTQTPTPQAIPRAYQTGKIDIGWIDTSALAALISVPSGLGSVTSAEFNTAVITLGNDIDVVSAALAALELDDLLDVSVPSPADNDVLAYDSAQGQWVAMAAVGVGSPNLDGGHADTEYGGVSVMDGGGA